MVSSQCIRSPTTALEYWTTPTHQPHSSHWGSSPWDCELDHSWSGWQTRHWTRNCTGTHSNNGTIMICSLLTILQCLHSESCTVWSSPSSIDCCHLHRVVGEWSQSSQHMLSAPLSCSVHNGGAIAVVQSVSSDESSLVRAGYCPPLHSQWPALHWCASEFSRSTSRGWEKDKWYIYAKIIFSTLYR